MKIDKKRYGKTTWNTETSFDDYSLIEVANELDEIYGEMRTVEFPPNRRHKFSWVDDRNYYGALFKCERCDIGFVTNGREDPYQIELTAVDEPCLTDDEALIKGLLE